MNSPAIHVLPMPTTSSPPSTDFSSLSPEIRSQIWRHALTKTAEPFLWPYKKGCWQPRFVTEADEDYVHDVYDGLYLHYFYQLLRMEFELPLFFVNREARGIARGWMSEQGIETRSYQGVPQPIFVRKFDCVRDALYVPKDKYKDFCLEPHDRAFEPDMVDQSYGTGGRGIWNIAIPEELFWDIMDGWDLKEDILEPFSPAALLIVVDAHGAMQGFDGHDEKQQQWNFESKRGRALTWDRAQRRFNWEGDGFVCDEGLYKRIEEVANRKILGMVDGLLPSFEIRPIVAHGGQAISSISISAASTDKVKFIWT